MKANGHRVLSFTTGYRIRAVEATDFAEEIAAFDRACQAQLKPTKPEDITECWVAFADDVPVGYAALEPSQNYKLTGYLARCAVLPEHRGQGLQRRFIRAREASARRQGWQWMISDTIENDVSSKNLADCGYRSFTPTKAKPWSFKGAIYWRKQIAATVKSEMPH